MGLTGQEKASIFLISLGEEIATEVLRILDPEDVRTLMNHMKRMKRVRSLEIKEVMKEAAELLAKGEIPLSGIEFTKNILSRGLPMEGISEDESAGPLDSLDDVKALLPFIRQEHPQVIAVLLSLLPTRKAAELLELLPENMKSEVCIRIASMEKISEEALEELAEVLKTKFDLTQRHKKALEGERTLAEILNNCKKEVEEEIMEKIEEHDPELAESIRDKMFVFEDLINIDDRGIQMLLKEVSTEELSVALKTASEALKNKIFKNMSQRASQILKDEMETRGPVRVSEVQKAQKNIIKIARKLEQEGKIVIGKGEDLV